MSFEHARTDRLVLDRPQDVDLQDVFEIHADPETNRHNPAGPSDWDECVDRLRSWQDEWKRDGHGIWIVREDAGGPAVGVGGISRRVVAGREVWNLGYRFRPSAWGKGYATEVARFALGLPESVIGATEIIAVINPTNTASAAVATRIGLQLVARVPYGGVDSDIYSSLAMPWPTDG